MPSANKTYSPCTELSTSETQALNNKILFTAAVRDAIDLPFFILDSVRRNIVRQSLH